VIKVEGREPTELKGEGATEKAVTGWAYAFWVTYRARPEEAVAPPAEAPPKEKAPTPTPKPKPKPKPKPRQTKPG
jgi:outer membrane biosynthesis protein TonB